MPTLANGPARLLPGHPLAVAIAPAVLLCHPFASDWLGRNRWAAGDAGENRGMQKPISMACLERRMEAMTLPSCAVYLHSPIPPEGVSGRSFPAVYF